MICYALLYELADALLDLAKFGLSIFFSGCSYFMVFLPVGVTPAGHYILS
jgi:hypothetical protein